MPRADCKIIRTKFCRMRVERGLTQEELARQAEVERRTVQRAEAGKCVTADTVRRLAAALKVNPAELLSPDCSVEQLSAIEDFNKLIISVRENSAEFLRQLGEIRKTCVGRQGKHEFDSLAGQATRHCRNQIDAQSNCSQLALKLRLAFLKSIEPDSWREFFHLAQRSLADFQRLAIELSIVGKDASSSATVDEALRSNLSLLTNKRDELIAMTSRFKKAAESEPAG